MSTDSPPWREWVEEYFASSADSARRSSSDGVAAMSMNPGASFLQGEWLQSKRTALPSALHPRAEEYSAFTHTADGALPSTFNMHARDRGFETYWLGRHATIAEAARRPHGSTGCSTPKHPDAVAADGDDAESLSLRTLHIEYLVPPPSHGGHHAFGAGGKLGAARRHYMARGRCYVEMELQTVVDSRCYDIGHKSIVFATEQHERAQRATIAELERSARWTLLLDRAYNFKLHGYEYDAAPLFDDGSNANAVTQVAGSMPEPLVQLVLNEDEARRAVKHACRRAVKRLEAFAVALAAAHWRLHDRAYDEAVGPVVKSVQPALPV